MYTWKKNANSNIKNPSREINESIKRQCDFEDIPPIWRFQLIQLSENKFITRSKWLIGLFWIYHVPKFQNKLRRVWNSYLRDNAQSWSNLNGLTFAMNLWSYRTYVSIICLQFDLNANFILVN